MKGMARGDIGLLERTEQLVGKVVEKASGAQGRGVFQRTGTAASRHVHGAAPGTAAAPGSAPAPLAAEALALPAPGPRSSRPARLCAGTARSLPAAPGGTARPGRCRGLGTQR